MRNGRLLVQTKKHFLLSGGLQSHGGWKTTIGFSNTFLTIATHRIQLLGAIQRKIEIVVRMGINDHSALDMTIEILNGCKRLIHVRN